MEIVKTRQCRLVVSSEELSFHLRIDFLLLPFFSQGLKDIAFRNRTIRLVFTRLRLSSRKESVRSVQGRRVAM